MGLFSPRASRSLSGKVVVLVVVLLVTHSKNSLPDKTKVAHLIPVPEYGKDK